MPYELLTCYMKLPLLALVLARLGGMILIQPVLSSAAVPTYFRVLFVGGLAVLITPLVTTVGPLPETLVGLVVAMAGEVLLGLLMGLVVAIAFVGVQMGGTLIAQESGIAFGEIVDPSSGQELSVFSGFYAQLTTVVYLIIGGHRLLLAACLDTFRDVPLLGDAGMGPRGTELLLGALTAGGEMAIRVGAPALLTLFLVNVALGFISRTVPQLNITTVGFAIKGLLAFVVMAIALPSAIAAFTDGLELGFDYIQDLLGT